MHSYLADSSPNLLSGCVRSPTLAIKFRIFINILTIYNFQHSFADVKKLRQVTLTLRNYQLL